MHGVVTRRFTVDLVGAGRVTAVEVPAGRVRGVHRRPARAATASAGSAPSSGCRPRGCWPPSPAEEDDDAAHRRPRRGAAPRAPEPPGAYLDLLGLVGRMADDRGLVRVDQVAALAGMSVRSLQRLFATYVGVSPKAVLARYRLQDAAAAIDAGRGRRPGRASPPRSGWFDQAHFSRDFRAVVGMTPVGLPAAARQLDRLAGCAGRPRTTGTTASTRTATATGAAHRPGGEHQQRRQFDAEARDRGDRRPVRRRRSGPAAAPRRRRAPPR